MMYDYPKVWVRPKINEIKLTYATFILNLIKL